MHRLASIILVAALLATAFALPNARAQLIHVDVGDAVGESPAGETIQIGAGGNGGNGGVANGFRITGGGHDQSVQLFFNGTDITTASTIAQVQGGVSVKYTSPSFFPVDTTNMIALVLGDGAAPQGFYTNTWQFVTAKNIPILAASMTKPADSGIERGFSARLVQSLNVTNFPHTLESVEQQLAGTLVADGIPVTTDRLGLDYPAVINYQLYGTNGLPLGTPANFGPPRRFPSLPDGYGPEQENFALETVAYLQLDRGAYRLGVNAEAGFRLTAGPTP